MGMWHALLEWRRAHTWRMENGEWRRAHTWRMEKISSPPWVKNRGSHTSSENEFSLENEEKEEPIR